MMRRHAGGFTLIEVCSFPDHLDYHDPVHVTEAARMGADSA